MKGKWWGEEQFKDDFSITSHSKQVFERSIYNRDYRTHLAWITSNLFPIKTHLVINKR